MRTNFLDSGVSGASRRESFLHPTSRALALFFGGFSLLNLLGNFHRPGFDLNLWWLDLRALPEIPATIFLFAASLFLVGFAFRPPRTQWRRLTTAMFTGALAAACLWNIVEFYALLTRGIVHTSLPVPLSLFVFAALLLIARENLRSPVSRESRSFSPAMLAAFAICLAIFPLAQMFCFGQTDYRRPADVAVVFGARAYRDGHPSDALADRVTTACQLYRDGLVRKLIFSGGPGDGPVPETESMRRLALRLGVSPGDILTDDGGLNTQNTVRNTEAMFAQLHARQILVVSHFYHLPRIKMAYQRAGREVFTVPAKERRIIWKMPFFVVREAAADWVYYLRPLF